MFRFSQRRQKRSGFLQIRSRSTRQERWFHPTMERLEDRTVPNTYTVTSNANSGGGTLRQAITDANANPGTDTIAFNLPGGQLTISPSSALPTITGSVVIDGTTQPGYSDHPLVVLHGSSTILNGLFITAGGSTVQGLVINGFSGSTAAAIHLSSNGGNTISGNWIGTDATGTGAVANGQGVSIDNSPSNSVIGNTISGNSNYGIQITQSGATGNQVQGNFIGTNATGTAAVANGYGIVIFTANNFVTANTISGNTNYAVFITGGATNNQVQGNKIGTNAAGTGPIANGYGVQITSANNVVGGTASGAGNTISGNTNHGVFITGSGATGNQVQGNKIGTNTAGTAALANGTGVVINNSATNNTVGGTASGAGNTISGNTFYGVWIWGSGTTGNQVQGNKIGTDIGGTNPVANSYGVYIESANNTVGGTATGAGNTISRNTNVGVYITGAAATGNRVTRNSIFANGGLGIDLAAGANGNQNFPVLSQATSGATTRIIGTLNSTPNSTFTLDFYANTAPDPSGFGEGQRYLGSTTVTTNAAGNAPFDLPLAAATANGEWVTATATDPAGNTSKFSLAWQTTAATGLAVGTVESTYGGTTSLTATLTSGGNPVSGKTVTFTLNGASVGTATTNSSGVATLSNVSLSGINAGTYAGGVGASFAGDSSYQSSSGTASLTVNKATLTVTADPASRLYGAPDPVFAADYSGFVLGQTLATSGVGGSPSFSTNATASSPVSGSPYTITPALGLLTADNYGFTFATGRLTITPADTTTTLVSWLNPSSSGEAVTFMATVAAASPSSAPIPAGELVTFNEGTTTLGTGTLDGDGHATLNTNSLAVGSHSITATYGGDANLLGSTSPTLTQVVHQGQSATVALSTPPASTYGDEVTFSASVSAVAPASGTPTGSVNFVDQTTGTDLGTVALVAGSASLSTTVLTAVNHTIVVTYSGDTTFTGSSGTTSEDVARAPLTVTTAPKTKTYGQTLTAFTGSITGLKNGDDITLSFSSPGAAAAAGAGSYPITATLVYPGHTLDNYSVTNPGNTLTVNKAALTATANDASRSYGSDNPAFTASYSGFVNGETLGNSGVSGSPSLTTTATPSSAVGTYTITATLGTLAADNYTFTVVDGTLSITKAAPAVTVTGGSFTYDGNPHPATGTATGVFGEGLGFLSFTYSPPGDATMPFGAGHYVATGHYAGSSNYLAASADADIFIAGTDTAFSSLSAPTITYGTSTVSLSGYISSGYLVPPGSVSVTLNSVTAIAVIDGGTGAFSASFDTYSLGATDSPYTITYDYAGSTNFNAAHDASHVLTVNPAALTVVTDAQSKTYGQTFSAFTGQFIGLQNNDNITASYSSAGAAPTATVGQYDITATLNDPTHKLGNYTVTNAGGTLTVTPAALTVTTDPQSKTYGQTIAVFTGTVSGQQNGDDITGTYSSTGGAAGAGAGSYAITATLSDPDSKLGNYTVSNPGATLAVGKATPSIVVSGGSFNYDGYAHPATGSATGVLNDSLAVTFTYTPGGTTAPVNVGDYDVLGQFAGNSNYLPASASAAIHITAAGTTFSSLSAPTITYGTATATLSGTVSATALVPDSSVSITLNGVTMAAPVDSGTGAFSADFDTHLLGVANSPYAITYDYAGDANHDGAHDTSQKLTVTRAALTVTTAAQTKVYGETFTAFTGGASGQQNGDAITVSFSSAGADATAGAGSYSIVATLNDPDGKLGNYTVSNPGNTLTVNKATPTVSVTGGSFTYDGNSHPATGSVTGVAGADLGSPAITYTPGNSTAPVNVGDYDVLGQFAGNSNYLPASASAAIHILGTATVFSSLSAPTISYGTTSTTLAGSVSAGDLIPPGSVSITLNGVTETAAIDATGAFSADFDTHLLSVTNSPYTITYDYAGDVNFSAAHDTSYRLTVTPASLTVTTDPQLKTYGEDFSDFTGSIGGLQNGDNITVSFSSDGAAATAGAGSHAIVATLSDPDGKLGNYTVSNPGNMLTINKATPTITVSGGTFTDDGNPHPATGSVLGVLSETLEPITFTYTPPGDMTEPVNVGHYDVFGQFAGDSNYLPASAGAAIDIVPVTGTAFSFLSAPTITYGTASAVLAGQFVADSPMATGSVSITLNGVTESAAIDDTGAFSANFDTHLLDVANSPYVIVYDYAGDDAHGPAHDAGQVLTVTPAALTVTMAPLSKVYGQTSIQFTGHISGLKNGDAITATFSSAGAAATAPVGTYDITTTLSDPDSKLANYTVSYPAHTLTVTPARLTVVTGAKTKTYGQTFTAFTGRISGQKNNDGITISFSSPGAAATASVGSYQITATLSDPNNRLGNYTVINNGSVLTVRPARLTVVTASQSKTYGQSFTFTSDQVRLVGLKNGDNIAATLSSPGAAATAPVGNYVITATLGDPDGKFGNYTVVNKGGTLTVRPARLTVVTDPQSKVYGQIFTDLTGSISGLQNGDDITAGYSSPGAVATASVGRYAITATLSDPDGKLGNYTVVNTGGTLTVTRATLTVVTDPQSKVYGQTFTDFSGAVNGLQNGDNIAATYSSSGAAPTAGVGKYTITATLSDPDGKLGNYTVVNRGGTLTVTRAPLTVVTDAESKVYGQTFTDFSGSISGLQNGDAVTATYSSRGAAASAAVGSYAITATLHDPDGKLGNYTVTNPGNTLTVARDDTTTAAGSSASTSGFGQALTLSAVVTANAPGSGTPTGTVAFYDTTTAVDLGVAALSGGTATLTRTNLVAGSHTITVTYNGDRSFLTSSGSLTVTILESAYVLNKTAAGALTLSGNAGVQMGGVVVVDSSSASALSVSDNATVSAAAIRVVGGVSSTGHPTLSPSPITGAAYVADPLAGLAVPSGGASQGAVSLSGTASQTINPGVYSNISVSGGASLTLNPGVYVIAGGGFTVTGGASVSGSGIMIYNAGANYPSTGGPFGGINLSGTGAISLEPAATGPYAGILVYQARDNASTVALSGSGISIPTGVIYAPNPSAPLVMSGGQFKGSLVAGKLNISGNTVAQLTAGSGGTAVYAPDQARTAYGINNQSLDGTGQTIAIVDAYDNPTIYQSLDAFDAQFGPTASGATLYELYGPASSFLTVLNQRGDAAGLPDVDPAGPGSDNWEVETALDVEWVHAVAPGARIVLVEADSQSMADLMAAVATAARQPGVSVVSMSWGFPEGQSALAEDEALYDGYFTTPADHQGVTFVASTGDYGAAVPLYPALSPNVVAVGGTRLLLNADNSRKSEAGWGNYVGAVGTFLGSGGGLSQYASEPSYQQGMQSTGRRTTPDVSLLADPDTGAWVADPYNLSGDDPWEVVGGTSLSAPAWAGLLALANQGRVEAGAATLGTAGPTEALAALYGLSAADYHDVSSGGNGYEAGPGYDLVSGLGSPAADLVIADLVAYTGGAGSATPVAPIASSGLVLSADAGRGGGSIEAVAQAAARRVFAALLLPAPAARPNLPGGDDHVFAVAVATAPGAGPGGALPAGVRVTVVDGPLLGDGGARPAAVGGGARPAEGRGNPVPESRQAVGSAALSDGVSAFDRVPGRPVGALRSEVPADDLGALLGDEHFFPGSGSETADDDEH
jgi:hypothetical protein